MNKQIKQRTTAKKLPRETRINNKLKAKGNTEEKQTRRKTK
jgi:hypothetical protein